MDLSSLRISVAVMTEVAEKKLNELQGKVSSFSEKASKTLAGMSDGMKKSGEAITNFGNGLTKAGKNVESLGKKLSVVTAAVGTVLGVAFNKAKSFIGTYESAMTVFERKLEGGKEAAEDLYQSLLTVAKGSSFAQEYLVSAGQTLVAMGVDAKKTTKYVQTATNAIAGMGGSGTEIQEMSELFGKISQQTNLYTQDIQQMVTRGIPAWDILATKYKTTTDAVKKMASDGLLPASECLDVITDALNESDQASEMYQYSIEGLAKKLKDGTLTGAIDSLNTSFRTFSLRLLDLDPTTESGKKNIERLNSAISKFGETIEKIGGKFSFVGDWISSGLEKITSFLDKFNSALDSMPESQAQAIAKVIASLATSGPALILVGNAMKNFGGSFSAIGKAISSFSGFGGMIEKLGKSGNFIEQLVPSFAQIGSGIVDVFKPLGNATGGMLSKLGQNIVGFLSPLGEKIGGLLSPISEKIVGTFSSIGVKIGGFLAPLGEKIGGFLAPIGQKIGGFLGPIGEKIGGGLNGILGTVGKYAPQLMSGFTSAFNFSAIGGLVLVGLGLIQQNFGDKISEISTFLIEKGPEIITNFVNGIVTALPQLIEQGSQLLQTIINVINANLPAIVQAGISIISTLVIGLAQQLPTLIPMALDTILILTEALLDNIDLLIDAGIALIVGLAEGLINAIPKLIEKAPVLIEKLLTAIAKNLPKILEMGIKLLVELAMGLIKAIPQLVSKIPQIITAIIKALGEGLKGMADVGKDLVQGLWNGISNMVGWIKEKIQGFGESVLNGLKSFFGIASPSKLMRDKVGKFIAQGIGVGFSNEIANVEKSMVGEMENLTDSLDVGEIPYNASVSGKANVGLVNGLTTALQLNSGNQDINLVVDGRTLATVIYNPLNKLTQQKGVNAYA